jgi:hypothetical protein
MQSLGVALYNPVALDVSRLSLHYSLRLRSARSRCIALHGSSIILIYETEDD